MTKVKKSNFYELKNSNTERLEKANFETVLKIVIVKKIIKTQKLEFKLNLSESLTKLKTQILMKFTYSYCDKTQKLQF